MARNSILHRRKRNRIKKHFELQLTSMMDMFIIILIFLLKSYSASSVAFTTSAKITLPQSTTEEVPADSMNLIIEPTGITFDSIRVVDFILPPGTAPDLKSDQATYEMDAKLLGDGGRRILPLFDAMVKARENAELLMSKAKWVPSKLTPQPPDSKEQPLEKPKFQGIVTIQADKAVRYDLIRKIMYTAGAAQYKVFKFITIKKET